MSFISHVTGRVEYECRNVTWSRVETQLFETEFGAYENYKHSWNMESRTHYYSVSFVNFLMSLVFSFIEFLL